MSTRETAPPRTPWPYHLKRLHDQRLFRQEHGPGPSPCGAGDGCVMQGWHDQIEGLPKGPVDGGLVQQGDLTAIVAEGAAWHAECIVRRSAGECGGCGRLMPHGALTQHRRACSGQG